MSNKKSEVLLGMIRGGQPMTGGQKLNLIVQLSIPSILAQITSVMMFFIDQAMVGRISVEAAAACGLVESSTWLCGSMTSAASMGFSVQVAHFIGANDFDKARDVFRHGLLCTLIFSLCIMVAGLLIAPRLPYWLGGGADIAADATTYISVFMLAIPFFQLFGLSGGMLKCSGNMRIPSMLSIIMCVLDVTFNFILIFIFHLGVLGVALGTALSIIIVGSVQTYYAVVKSDKLALIKERILVKYINWDYIRNALHISLPMAAQGILMSGAQIVSTMIVAPLGNIAIAANTFAITAESLCYMPGYGLGEAVTTLGLLRHAGHGSDGCCDVPLRPRADDADDACSGNRGSGCIRTAHRGLCRTYVCSLYRMLQCLCRCWRHLAPRSDEPLLHVAGATHPGCLAGQGLWLAGCVDRHGH